MDKPLPVIPLNYGNIPRDAVTRRPVFPMLSVAACVVAVALIYPVDVETVLFSGPMIALMGVTLLIQGLKWHEKLRAILGGLHCATCLLFLVIVNLWHWGPARATTPFFIIGAAHTLVVAGITLQMWRRYGAGNRAG